MLLPTTFQVKNGYGYWIGSKNGRYTYIQSVKLKRGARVKNIYRIRSTILKFGIDNEHNFYQSGHGYISKLSKYHKPQAFMKCLHESNIEVWGDKLVAFCRDVKIKLKNGNSSKTIFKIGNKWSAGNMFTG